MRAPHEHPSDPRLVGAIFAAAQACCGVVVCGSCRRFMRLNRELGEGQISHGMCPACEADQSAAAERFFVERQEVVA